MSEEATLDEFAESSDAESKKVERRESRFWGEIPEGWELVDGTDVYDVNPNPKPDTEPNTYIEMDALDTELPWPKYFGKRNASEYSGKKFTRGDTLFARITPCTENGKAAFVPEMETTVGIGSTEYAVLSPKTDRINSWLLYYLAKSYPVHNYAVSRMRGSTGRQRVPFSVFRRELDISLPPIPEQRKIATVLYTIDRAIEKSKEIKTQLERTHNGLIQNFLTHGIQDSETIDTGTKLGEVPSHWEIVTIENILSDEDYSFTDGARYSLSSDEIQDSGDARAILLEEVKEGEFDDSNPKFATEEKYNEITHRAIYPGEVVVAKMAEPVARACIVPDTYEKYLLGCADVVRIVPSEEIEDRFLMYCMNSHKVWRQAVAHLRGTGRSRINLENISELYIPKPPLSEQREIVSILSGIDQQIDNEQQYRNNLQRLKGGLQQDLLSGTVRTTDTNIEVPDEIAQHG